MSKDVWYFFDGMLKQNVYMFTFSLVQLTIFLLNINVIRTPLNIFLFCSFFDEFAQGTIKIR